VVEEKLKDAIVEVSKNHTKAVEKKKEVEDKLEEQYALLKQSRQELDEIADKQSTAYSEAIGKVTTIEQNIEELEDLKNAYTTLAASKDSFVHKHNLTIKVLTSLRFNLQTHRAKLKSDTEERLKYYDVYVVALKARTDQ
jgi:DNA repair exonuclease SbcCD ATPase subunit